MPEKIIGYYGDWHVIEDDERREHVAYMTHLSWGSTIHYHRVQLTFPGDLQRLSWLPWEDVQALFAIVEIFGTRFAKPTTWPLAFKTPEPTPPQITLVPFPTRPVAAPARPDNRAHITKMEK